MRLPNATTLGALLLAAACSSDPDLDAAGRSLDAFQAALRRGDQAACRALLTRESQAAVADLPWQDLRGRTPLRVLGVAKAAGEFLVDVEDPNDGGRRSQFVVVREHGRLVVDLVATAGRHVEVVEAAAGTERFEPRALTPADEDRIRRFELSQPPR